MESENKTIPKTLMFYEKDIKQIKVQDVAPKNILRLGLQAYENGWSLAKETNQVEELKQRLGFMSKTLQLYIDKLNIVTKILNKKWGSGINIEDLTKEELVSILEKME